MAALLHHNEVDDQLMALVPPGWAVFGEGDAQFSAELPGYYLGVCCVTNARSLRFAGAMGHRPPGRANVGEPVWRGRGFPAELADHPVVCVSWDDARA